MSRPQNHESYPEPIIRFLELAEVETPVADIPPGLTHALSFCINKGFARIGASRIVGYTRSETTRKKALSLRPDDLIQFQPGDRNGFKVHSVTVKTHTVEVRGSGPDHTWQPNADVVVFDGPLPQPVYSESRLSLLPEGAAVLNLDRVEASASSKATAYDAPSGASDRTPPVPQNARARKQPSKDAIAVYRYQFATGKTQAVLATDPILMEILSREVSQGTISRWLNQVKKWLEAGNILPDLPELPRVKPAPMDPGRIDLGERQDGRAQRQKARRQSGKTD